MQEKTFTFELEINDVPYSEETVPLLYGEGATYNPDFGEDSLAKDTVFSLVQDAITYVHMMKMNFIAQNKIEDASKLEGSNKSFWEYLENKEKRYKKIEQTIRSKQLGK